MELSLPKAAARPGLENSHAHEERPHDAEDRPPEPSARPGPLGQGDEEACQAVEENGSRRSECPAETWSEDAAEALAEDPDDEPPASARQARKPRPCAPGRYKKPDAETHLNPHS